MWLPDTNKLNIVDETFNFSRKILSWKWGDISEKYGYNLGGQMASVTYGDNSELSYDIPGGYYYPKAVTLPSGHTYDISQSPNGGLGNIVTPSGAKHSFQSVPLVGRTMTEYIAPWSNQSYKIVTNDQGMTLHLKVKTCLGVLFLNVDCMGYRCHCPQGLAKLEL